MPWWALTILLIISFFFCVLYGIMAATIGFTQFNTSGTSFFQMITGGKNSVCMSILAIYEFVRLHRPRKAGSEYVWCSIRTASYDDGHCASPGLEARTIRQTCSESHIPYADVGCVSRLLQFLHPNVALGTVVGAVLNCESLLSRVGCLQRDLWAP